MTSQNNLTVEDFAKYILLPGGFSLEILTTFINEAVEDGLPALLSADDLALYNAYLAPTDEALPVLGPTTRTGQLVPLINKYLIYSAWADYALEGTLMATETGYVEKQRDDSLSITDAHRAEVRKKYNSRANTAALKLQAFSAASTACVAAPSRSGIRFGKAEGRTQSAFDTNTRINVYSDPKSYL